MKPIIVIASLRREIEDIPPATIEILKRRYPDKDINWITINTIDCDDHLKVCLQHSAVVLLDGVEPSILKAIREGVEHYYVDEECQLRRILDILVVSELA